MEVTYHTMNETTIKHTDTAHINKDGAPSYERRQTKINSNKLKYRKENKSQNIYKTKRSNRTETKINKR